MTSIRPTQIQASRELRLDFLRGVALLVVLVDHIEDHTSIEVLRCWTPVSTCFFDGAEAFVFLSGLVFGRAFQRRLEQTGLFACQSKASRRAITIYLTYLIASWISIGIGVCFRGFSELLARRLRLEEGVERCVLWTLPMCYQPWGLAILATYAVVLPCMPLVLYSQLRSPRTAWIAPFGIYIASQLVTGLQLPRFPWHAEWVFNPFAWQFLFFAGSSAGIVRARSLDIHVHHFELTDGGHGAEWIPISIAGAPGQSSQQPFRSTEPQSESWARAGHCRASIPKIRTELFIGAITIFELGLLIRNDLFGRVFGAETFQVGLIGFANQWSQKTRLGPVRLLHFLCFAYILSGILPGAKSTFWENSFLDPVIKCGQHSLVIYAFGVILMFLSIPLIQYVGHSALHVLFVDFVCCILSLCLAYSLSWFRRPQS